MKIIFSRKGFDSSAGGCPSPLFPDGSMLALPIPDKGSPIQYRDIMFKDIKVGHLVNHLTKGKITAAHRAHLDPDLDRAAYPRKPGWKPLLGQTGAAQGHLVKQGIAEGDLFLFFGLFREVELYQRKWRFVPGTTPKHVVWGWLQVGEILPVDQIDKAQWDWCDYHPHCYRGEDKNNTLYIARDELILKGLTRNLPGAGFFPKFTSNLCLTAPDSQKPSLWQLPNWFYPYRKAPLSYHAKMERWERVGSHCYLQCAARGQEFVLPAQGYPKAQSWVAALLQDALGIG